MRAIGIVASIMPVAVDRPLERVERGVKGMFIVMAPDVRSRA